MKTLKEIMASPKPQTQVKKISILDALLQIQQANKSS